MQSGIPSKFKKILLIDDDETDIYISKRVINSVSFAEEVETRSSGAEALTYLKDLHSSNTKMPDIIFLDLKMPGIDGMEFLEQLKIFSDAFHQKFRVVILTNAVAPEGQKPERSNNFVMFEKILLKPLTAEVLSTI